MVLSNCCHRSPHACTQAATHEAFPQPCKQQVRTLLLCYHRLVNTACGESSSSSSSDDEVAAMDVDSCWRAPPLKPCCSPCDEAW